MKEALTGPAVIVAPNLVLHCGCSNRFHFPGCNSVQSKGPSGGFRKRLIPIAVKGVRSMKNRPGVVLLTLLLCTSILVAQQPQQQPSPTTPAAAPTTAQPAAGAQKPATPEPPKEKAFADVVKDAQVIKGLFTMYRTDEKVYLEILPEQLEKIFLVSLTVDSGIGERGFYAASMAGEAPMLFHKQGKNVQLM